MRPTARTALLGALACLLGLAVLGMATAWSPALQAIDTGAAAGFAAAEPTGPGSLAARVARLADPFPYLVMGLALVAVALMRARPLRAGAVVVLLVVTGVTTQALKATLGHPRAGELLGADMASWPSGHATAAMTIALCAVLVAPRAWRGAVAAAGAAFALTAGVGVLVMEWHYASDVAAGYLVATGWTLLAVAALRPLERPAPAQAPARGGPWGWIVAAAIAAALAAQVSAGSLASFAADHTWAALTTAGLCVMAAALAASLAAVLRR